MVDASNYTPRGFIEVPVEIILATEKPRIDWRRIFFITLGIAVFLGTYYMPPWPVAVDPTGRSFELTAQGKGAIALFLLAGIWWVFEVVPIGVTAIAIGVFQALFAIRSAKDAFKDFMDPSVMSIFASVVVGLAFTKTGLTKRLAYKMLQVVGEKTNMILLGALVVTAGLAHVMAHTAAAATVFPILLAIYSLYGEGESRQTSGRRSSSEWRMQPGQEASSPSSGLPVRPPAQACLPSLPAGASVSSNLLSSRSS